ncbi:MAG: ChbG/HpnK family deacetylase [Flavobacteriales bacterium]|nr:ChbG/HpnK family deacetylase [Flavobacteriales bacterium]
MPRRIIVNADDLGLSPSVNTAIFEVFRAGNLSSATFMVNMPGAQDAADRLRELPGLAVGLHFCITEGRSSVGASSLTDPSGNFLPRPRLTKAVLRGRIDERDVQRELEAQLDALRSFGIAPTHIDSHQHVHMLPPLMDAVRPMVEREGLAMRLVQPPPGAVRAAWGRPPKALKQWLNGRFSRHARRRGVSRANDLLVSIHDLDGPGPYDATTYADLLKTTPGTALVEVMVHPYLLGRDVLDLYGPVMTAKRPFLDRCAAEFAALSGAPVFGDAQLVNYAMVR